MRVTAVLCRLVMPALFVSVCNAAYAQNTPAYLSATNEVTVPSLVFDGVTYHDLVVKVGELVSFGGGGPKGTVNTYDASLNQVTLPSVIVNGQDTFANVVFKPGPVSSVGVAELVPTELSAKFGLRGFNFAAFVASEWGVYADNAAAMDFIKAEGGNAVTLDWMIEFADDGTMLSNGGDKHPSVSDISNVILAAKSRGLYVVLKPHVISTVCCGQNRNSYNTDVNKFLTTNFFPAWTAYLTGMVSQLPMASVDAISIGTELDFLDWRNRSEWEALIKTMRGVFKGELTYDAMFSQWRSPKDIDDVVFWDLLDFISCSFYVRLTPDNTKSAVELSRIMRNTPNVDIADPIAYLKQISERHGKQVFTMEGGYQSANGALWGVNDFYGSSAIENQDLQARGLDAYLFTLNFNQGTWLKGVALWDLQSRYLRAGTWEDPNYRNGWGMYRKASANTVSKWYSIP